MCSIPSSILPSSILLRYISTSIILRSQIIACSLPWRPREEVLDLFKASITSKCNGFKLRFDILDQNTYKMFCNNSNNVCWLYKITLPWWGLFKFWQQGKHSSIRPNWLVYLCIRSSFVCLIPPFHISYSSTPSLHYCKAIWLNTLSFKWNSPTLTSSGGLWFIQGEEGCCRRL